MLLLVNISSGWVVFLKGSGKGSMVVKQFINEPVKV